MSAPIIWATAGCHGKPSGRSDDDNRAESLHQPEGSLTIASPDATKIRSGITPSNPDWRMYEALNWIAVNHVLFYGII